MKNYSPKDMRNWKLDVTRKSNGEKLKHQIGFNAVLLSAMDCGLPIEILMGQLLQGKTIDGKAFTIKLGNLKEALQGGQH